MLRTCKEVWRNANGAMLFVAPWHYLCRDVPCRGCRYRRATQSKCRAVICLVAGAWSAALPLCRADVLDSVRVRW